MWEQNLQISNKWTLPVPALHKLWLLPSKTIDMYIVSHYKTAFFERKKKHNNCYLTPEPGNTRELKHQSLNLKCCVLNYSGGSLVIINKLLAPLCGRTNQNKFCFLRRLHFLFFQLLQRENSQTHTKGLAVDFAPEAILIQPAASGIMGPRHWPPGHRSLVIHKLH